VTPVELDTSVIGAELPGAVITIERGPVTTFAGAVLDKRPEYRSAEAATSAGLRNIPMPPTFPFAMGNWGQFEEQQPEGWDAPIPTLGLYGELMKQGGLILHGEQEFIYHKDVVVGDVLTMTGRVKDVYQKASGDKTMTFIVSEQDYRNADGELVLTQVTTIIHRV
jgi:hypothetical protein